MRILLCASCGYMGSITHDKLVVFSSKKESNDTSAKTLPTPELCHLCTGSLYLLHIARYRLGENLGSPIPTAPLPA